MLHRTGHRFQLVGGGRGNTTKDLEPLIPSLFLASSYANKSNYSKCGRTLISIFLYKKRVGLDYYVATALLFRTDYRDNEFCGPVFYVVVYF